MAEYIEEAKQFTTEPDAMTRLALSFQAKDKDAEILKIKTEKDFELKLLRIESEKDSEMKDVILSQKQKESFFKKSMSNLTQR